MSTLKALYRLVICIVVAFASCKKEKLHFSKVEQLDSHSTDRLNAIYFEGNDGYAVGGSRFEKCTIIITHDGGVTWEKKDFPDAGKALYGVTETPAGNIVAIGFDGKLLTSADKGNSWRFNQIGTWQSYKDAAFVTNDRAIAISGHSYNSGGISYMDEYGAVGHWDSAVVEYNDIEMWDAYTGYIVGYGTVIKTTDGGKNWKQLEVINDNFRAISILNEREVWVCGANGSIFHTSNGGENWDKQRNGNSLTNKQYYLHDILFIDGNNGWAVGEKGVIIFSSDGGNTWKEYEHFTDDNLRSISLLPDNNLIVCGDNGALYKLIR